jgi:hypothetical protein
MDFWKAILGLARRKYIGLPVLGLALIIAALGYFLTPASYVSSTTMVLTTPTSGGTLSQDPTKPTGLTNPLLTFNEGLKTTSAILIQAMNTPEVAKQIGATGGTKLIIDDGSSNPSLLGVNGPFVYIQGTSKSAEEARGVVLRAQKRVREELDNRQKALGAPPITFISMVDVVAPSPPIATHGAQLQIAGVALVLTILLGLGGAYFAQRLLLVRTRRATSAAAEGEPTPAPPAPPVRDRAALLDPPTVRTTPVAAPAPNGVQRQPHLTNGNGSPHPVNPAKLGQRRR